MKHTYNLYQLRRGIYVNEHGETVCYLDDGNFFAANHGGEYHLYTLYDSSPKLRYWPDFGRFAVY